MGRKAHPTSISISIGLDVDGGGGQQTAAGGGFSGMAPLRNWSPIHSFAASGESGWRAAAGTTCCTACGALEAIPNDVAACGAPKALACAWKAPVLDWGEANAPGAG
eukprot:CAMPEP_0198244610 /NCGR_PEP_ID=MMETSP1446-20131203/36357_1 /TAXON_ID=1461542 ORGANISM="Unidentified sp, Strain CCMP2111" /NCGR_SAMPLE_ID=MMETSP1446 /ASSEMBLY_ACC=CAM_ASM_001112 /LENGTH=106 /DNA_ID=CAMNT_0043928681 /DNA_START=108 /DNA_END=426 /DNA_ORIENTATION=+